jgi:hypothetical protein
MAKFVCQQGSGRRNQSIVRRNEAMWLVDAKIPFFTRPDRREIVRHMLGEFLDIGEPEGDYPVRIETTGARSVLEGHQVRHTAEIRRADESSVGILGEWRQASPAVATLPWDDQEVLANLYLLDSAALERHGTTVAKRKACASGRLNAHTRDPPDLSAGINPAAT